jgi:hypothetical protein
VVQNAVARALCDGTVVKPIRHLCTVIMTLWT